ncbi:GNAT family N-acetyltransferase [Streptomyces sp. NPDC021969]|uniref:GNAT family N-acetyltransferase n=1 Tax=unclassified Streptomyces TaxID=2593676 RepID=UPI0033FBFD0F
MPKPTEVDQDSVVRARNILLASGRRTPREEVDACRVLARVSPAAYLPRLARALRNLSYDRVYRDRPEDRLALCKEAVAAARALDPAHPKYADVLYDALDGCQRALYTLGRRAEGLAVRAEMLAVGRTRAESSGDGAVWGLSPWAAGLLEEGRYAEAADVLSESVARGRPHGPQDGTFAWTLLEWIAALDAAGRSDEALTAVAELLAVLAAGAAKDGTRACRLYVLIRYAQMLDDALRHAEATAVRQEALALFQELAVHGEEEAKSWSGYHAAFWALLFFMSVADSERPAAGQPRPPVGTDVHHWSPEVRERYFQSRETLRADLDRLALRAAGGPDGPDRLAEQIRLHRMLTVRWALSWGWQKARLRELFDEGVTLARDLRRQDSVAGSRALATALTSRATFRMAVTEFTEALDDFRQAMELHRGPLQAAGRVGQDADMTEGSHSGLPRENIELPDGSVLRRRSLVSDDAFIDAVAADVGHLGEWLRWAQHPPTREETERFRAEQDADWDAGRSFVYVLTPPGRPDRVLGGGALFPNGEAGVLEIGYWVCSPATGRGLATRAAAALTEEGLGLPGVKAVEIHCDRANARSAAIPPRIGYRLLRVEPDEPQTAAEAGQSMVWRHDSA